VETKGEWRKLPNADPHVTHYAIYNTRESWSKCQDSVRTAQ
jgi:hypothetical protein